MKKVLIFLLVGIFLTSFVSAACTVTLDKTDYFATETATATMSCSLGNEKSVAYTLTWVNSTGSVLETDTGITPTTAGESFFETLVFPAGANYTGNVTLTGSNLEGSEDFNVTPTGGTGALLISDVVITPTSELFLGKDLGIRFIAKDENDKKISNAQCQIDIESGDEIPIVADKDITHDGRGQVNFHLSDNFFDEARGYRARISCYCGGTGTELACIDEDGTEVTNSIGSSSDTFTTNTWLNVNTVTGKSLYNMREEIFICANISNLNYDKRVAVRINNEARCSAGSDNNDDLDRALILSDISTPDLRGVSQNTTQMQCKRFIIPEASYLQGKNSECYASTDVLVLDENDEKVASYHTTSPVFNITSDELNLYPDWERISDYTFNSIINLSHAQFTDYNGTGTGNVDIKLVSVVSRLNTDQQQEIEGIDFANLLASEHIKNITVTNSTNSSVSWSLESLEDGSLEIELRSVDISQNGWYNVTLYLNSFNERRTDALEGIENKTGTFHLDVECPSTGTIGSDMSCVITAYVEDSQIVEKEVDFTCYISDGISQYSAVNFNQMITRNAFSTSRSFSVPSTFSEGTQYVLQCTADYYNLGSRRDSFYDTFTASTTSGGGGGSSGSSSGNETGGAPITGGVTDEGDGEEKPRLGPEDFNPFSPDRNWAFMFVEIIILIGLIILIYSLTKKKRKNQHHHHHNESNWEKIIKKVFAVIIILLLISLLGAGIWYGYSIVKDSFSEKAGVEQATISEIGETSQILLQGNLIKSIFLIFIAILIISLIIILFTVILFWVLFKLLNVRGEIKFGNDHFTRSYYEDRKSAKLQQKLNQIMLKNEIKRETTKEDYKVRKMTQQEFADFIKKKNSR